MKKIDNVVKRRFEIYKRYKSTLEKYTWIQNCEADVISNFGLGLMIDNINEFVKYIDPKFTSSFWKRVNK